MTLIYRPQSATVHLLLITLTKGTSRADQSRFYKRMRQAMWRSQIIMTSSDGLCMNLGFSGADPKRERETIMCWLINQPLVREVILDPPRSLKETLDDQASVYLGLRAQFDHARALIGQELYRRLVTGVVVQAINRRRYAEGA